MFRGDVLTARCRSLCESSGGVIEVSAAAAARFAAEINLVEVRPALVAPPSQSEAERTASLLLCWNAINFSYYADEGASRWKWLAPDGTEHGADDEANGVVAALTDLNRQATIPLSDPAFLQTIDEHSLREKILKAAPQAGELPLARERAAALREIGQGLARLGLSPLGLVQAAEGSAARLVATLVREFPSYSDVQCISSDVPAAQPLEFHKRAQLCVSMLHGARIAGGFTDIEALTVFADYRLPQLFRAPHIAIFRLAPRLASAIDSHQPIERGCEDEILLRAATVWAAAMIGDELRKRASDITQAQLDYYLWRTAVGQDAAGELPAFHRTRCTAY